MSQTPFDFFNLFVRPPGDLIYFLLVIALSQVAFFVALGQRLRRPHLNSMQPYVIASGGLMAAWVLMVIGALYVLLNQQDARAILPPLERVATVATLLLVGWAFLTADQPVRGRVPDMALAVLLIIVILGYATTGLEWSVIYERAEFNATTFGVTWAVIPAAISLFGMILIGSYYRVVSDAPLKLLFFAVLFIGFGLTVYQIAQGQLAGDHSGPARLAMVAALPLLPAVIYRLVIQQLEEDQPVRPSTPGATIYDHLSTALEGVGPVEAASTAKAIPERESAQLMKTLGNILEGATPENIPDRIVTATLQAVQADIGVLLTVHDAHYADIVTGYDRFMNRTISGMTMNLEHQPTLVNAIERRMQRPLYTDRNQEEIRDFYNRLDVEQAGPVYFQPMVHGRELIGVLVVALPYTGRELDEWAQELLRGIGIIAANLLALSNAAEDARTKAEERLIQAMVQPVLAGTDDTILNAWRDAQSALEMSRDQITELNRQVMTLKLELDDERSRVADALTDTREGQSISRRILTLNHEHQILIEERDRLSTRLREAETALTGATATDNEAVFKAMIDVLNREKDELLQQRSQLQSQLTDIRSQASAPQMVQDMLAQMTEEKAQIESERETLGARLDDIENQLRAMGIEEGTTGLTRLISQLYEQRASLQSRNETLQRERDALLNERGRLTDRIQREEERDKQLQTLQQEIKNLAADREAITRQREQMRAERDESISRQDMLKEQRARLTAQVASFEQELAEVVGEQQQLRAELQKSAEQRANLAVQRDTLDAERQALLTDRDQLLARLDGDRSRMEAVSQEGVGSLTQIIEDLSRQREDLEQELNEARMALDGADQRMRELMKKLDLPVMTPAPLTNPQVIVSMVQELRTPMTSMIGYVDLLLGESAGILGEMQRKFLQRVSANITRLASMLEDLIQIAMLDSGNFTLDPQPVDMIGVIEDSLTSAGNQLREKDLVVHMNLEDDIPPVKADLDAMQQVMNQLLTNAYLVSNAGDEIFITARRQAVAFGMNGSKGKPVECLVVSVEDRGGGIAQEDQVRVFVRKYKAENPLIQGLGDTGVGMSIVKTLVEAHSGKIWLSNHGKLGSIFTFALPLSLEAEPQG